MRALLVEDHNLFRELLAVVLKEETDLEGTVQARSLAEARRALGDLSGEIDLVMVALALPAGDARVGPLFIHSMCQGVDCACSAPLLTYLGWWARRGHIDCECWWPSRTTTARTGR
jgi:hypothetical protein